jgi:DNA segregation ATPase FtsK/SpoIIIE, S-DNA-T family
VKTFVLDNKASVKFQATGLLIKIKSAFNKNMLLSKKVKAELASILGVGLSIFVALSLWSYQETDTSFHTLSWGKPVQNWCGFAGSFLSDALLRFLGFGSWILVFYGFTSSLRVGVTQKFHGSWSRILWGFALLFLTTALIQTHWSFGSFYQNHIEPGGLVGLVLLKGFSLVFNSLGAQVIFWMGWFFSFVMFFDQNLTDMIKFFLGHLKGALFLSIKILSQFFFSMTQGSGQLLSSMRKKKRSYLYSNKKLRNTAESSSVEKVEKNDLINSKNFLNKPKGDQQGLYQKELREQGSPKQGLDHRESDQQGLELDSGSDQGQNFSENSSQFLDIKTEICSEKSSLGFSVKRSHHVENWSLPKLNLLEDPPQRKIKIDHNEIKERAKILKDKLGLFGVTGDVTGAKSGPAVTLYEFKPDSSVKISKITELADDLSMALSSQSLRIMAPIPGRDVVGIETANKQREVVYHKEMLEEDSFWSEDIKLPMALGRRVDGSVEIVDLRKMPHLLIAGTTGSGKSVFTVSTLIGLIFRHSPQTLKLILIDPKQVDLAAFEKIPHLAMPLVTDSKKAVQSLKWAVGEMEKRYKSMSQFGARGLEAFNEIVSRLSSEAKQHHEQCCFEYERTPGKKQEMYYYEPQPYLVIVVEEFADLMTVDKGHVEQCIIRLAQKARACGIHLVLCLQSPRKEFVTGAIKSNIPGRIAFKAASSMESRIILDETGAERLLASGDMLYRGPGSAHVVRYHGPYLKDQDIANTTEFWSNQSKPVFDDQILSHLDGGNSEGGSRDFLDSRLEAEMEQDDRYDEILHWMQTQKEVSASLIQRRFALGYPRAARLIESFEREGLVGPTKGSKPRPVLIHNLKELS